MASTLDRTLRVPEEETTELKPDREEAIHSHLHLKTGGQSVLHRRNSKGSKRLCLRNGRGLRTGPQREVGEVYKQQEKKQ